MMIDTNVVVDILDVGESDGSRWSRSIYRRFVARERLVCNLVIVAELVAGGASPADVTDRLDRSAIDIVDMTVAVAFSAGQAHRRYRQRGGARQTILADFLIGGHAEALGAALVTRDRRMAGYFPDLTLITPETHP